MADRDHDQDRRRERPPGMRALDPVEAYQRRTRRIREQIARNRRGEYAVPTWVLGLALVLVVAVWIIVLFVI